jgi:hypothetical protein
MAFGSFHSPARAGMEQIFGEYFTQVTAMGSIGLEYLGAEDDPRNNNS